ncbi:glutathione S-transferase family protein [Cohaesibacter celericrescens]|uniref:Glutathione S-transferase family protein n=1 Tax=Cohaesibacter celericrescens TaxID=2067669 RepID=A0A2N5XX16_9HYPH|nr:glutathione S-transferase family protein [Cohaesibacter celericrescens]PLW78997.1 glutathione S-transferase family protein [Cohaesibacter celericrescens]
MPILATNNPDITSLKGIHLYHAGMSNCSMRVRLALEEKGLEWVSHEINLGQQENIQDWYLAINPKGLVPSIIHDGVPVTESDDILAYLEEKFPEPALVPTDQTLAAEANKWFDLAVSMHIKAIKTWVYSSTVGATKRRSDMAHYAEVQPDKELVTFHQKSLDGFSKEEVEAAREMIVDAFRKMESRLEDHKYLVGDAQSIADIAWLPQYVVLDTLGFDFAPYPAIIAWAKRQERRPAYKAAISNWMPKIPGWALRAGIKIMRTFRKWTTARPHTHPQN